VRRLQTNSEKTSRRFTDVCSLRPLLPFGDFKFDRIPFLQAFIPLGSNCAVVNKNIGAILAPDEPVPLRVVEPFDRTFQTFHLSSPRSARPLDSQGSETCPLRMHFVTIRMGCQDGKQPGKDPNLSFNPEGANPQQRFLF
jgi:hypothetical protein